MSKEYTDAERIDFMLAILYEEGSDGLISRLSWEVCTRPTRGHIDLAMRLNEQAKERQEKVKKLFSERERIDREIAALNLKAT